MEILTAIVGLSAFIVFNGCLYKIRKYNINKMEQGGKFKESGGSHKDGVNAMWDSIKNTKERFDEH